MKKVMVTGASGLIGNAVRCLLEAQGIPVVPTDLCEVTDEGKPLVPLDIRDVHRLHEIVRREQVDAIVHCGALSGPMLGKGDPALVVSINTVGAVNVLEVARLHGVRRVIMLSSVSAYGHTPDGMLSVPEDVILRPNTVYGASKVAMEAIMRGYVLEYGLDAIALRPGWLYGPRRSTFCEIKSMLLGGQNGKAVQLAAEATALRQFLHVDDMAHAICLALSADGLKGRTYTIDGAETVPLSTVVDKIHAIFPSLDVTYAGTAAEDRQAPFDISAAKAGFGFEPTITLDMGIPSYLEWIQNHT